MFSYQEKTVKHALDLAPSHIRYKKHKPLPIRKTASRGGSYFASNGIFSLLSNRNQRCIVKISYTKNSKTRSWAAHGQYLQREHAQAKGEKGYGFDQQSNTVDLCSTLRKWQQNDDEHMFRLIISPENGHRLDLKEHAKDLMHIVEKDLKTKLEWVAIDHHNTDHPHLHILIRGIDDRGKTLTIEKDYLTHGFRHQSQELATRVLGIRLNRDIVQSRTRQLEREYITELDKSIVNKSENFIINYNSPVPDNLLSREQRLLEIGRLKFLESFGLAEKIAPKAWKLDPDLQAKLNEHQLSNDIIKSLARHNSYPINHEIPSPTEINENKPLTGKVIGMGLDNEIKDQRYLLIEGIDGKAHYLKATGSIVKARDNLEFGNNDVITITKRKFINEKKEIIEYLKIQNHFSVEKLENAQNSRIDRDIIEFVKTHGEKPEHLHPQESFAYEYAASMLKQFKVLESVSIITKENDCYQLSQDWEKKLAALNTKKEIELKREGNFIKSQSTDKNHAIEDKNRGQENLKLQDHSR